MLLGFLGGLAAHPEPQGEGWLVLSDFAEHPGLHTRAWLFPMKTMENPPSNLAV